MRLLRALVGAVVAAGVAGVCSALAAEAAPEQIVHDGRPITLGDWIEAEEFGSVRDLKFRLGTLPLDGKPALVASGVLETRSAVRNMVIVTVHTYTWREDVKARALGAFVQLHGLVDVTDPGKPRKFYAVGVGQPVKPGTKPPRPPGALLYHVRVELGGQPSPGYTGDSTVPGDKPDELIHDARPIRLGAWLDGTELFTVRDVKFRMGKLLDGKPALVASGQVDCHVPMGERRLTIHMQAADKAAYLPRAADARHEPSTAVSLYCAIEKMGAAKQAKFIAVGYPRWAGSALPTEPGVPRPDKLIYSVRYEF